MRGPTPIGTARAHSDPPLPRGCRLPLGRPLRLHRDDAAKPRTTRTPDEPPGPDPIGAELLHRERSGTEDVPLGTADDGALHQVHRVPSPTKCGRTTTLGDERDAPASGAPTALRTQRYASTPVRRSRIRVSAINRIRGGVIDRIRSLDSTRAPRRNTPGASDGVQCATMRGRSTVRRAGVV